jgi:hypothetical protein
MSLPDDPAFDYLNHLKSEEERRALINRIIERDVWLPDDASEDLKGALAGRHQYRYLLEKVINAAVKDGLPLREAGPQAADIVSGIRHAATAYGDHSVHKQLNFWEHVDLPAERIRSKDFPQLYRTEIERAAASYLQGPIRAPEVDRLYVDLLVAVELFAYAAHVSNPWIRMMSPQPRHPLVTYARGRAMEALLFGGIIGVTLWLDSSGRLSETVTFWTMLTCLGLFAISSVYATISLPFAWRARAQGKYRPTQQQLLSLMVTLYQDLESDGAISASHIRDKAKKADEQGVGWPATLFALLDDIASRTGRF